MRVLWAFIWWFLKQAAGLIKSITWNLSGREQGLLTTLLLVSQPLSCRYWKETEKNKRQFHLMALCLTGQPAFTHTELPVPGSKLEAVVALRTASLKGEAPGWNTCACPPRYGGCELQCSNNKTPNVPVSSPWTWGTRERGKRGLDFQPCCGILSVSKQSLPLTGWRRFPPSCCSP